jgi:hypothetical protein
MLRSITKTLSNYVQNTVYKATVTSVATMWKLKVVCLALTCTSLTKIAFGNTFAVSIIKHFGSNRIQSYD